MGNRGCQSLKYRTINSKNGRHFQNHPKKSTHLFGIYIDFTGIILYTVNVVKNESKHNKGVLKTDKGD